MSENNRVKETVTFNPDVVVPAMPVSTENKYPETQAMLNSKFEPVFTMASKSYPEEWREPQISPINTNVKSSYEDDFDGDSVGLPPFIEKKQPEMQAGDDSFSAAGGVAVKARDANIGVEEINNSIVAGDGAEINIDKSKTINKNRFDSAIGMNQLEQAPQVDKSAELGK